MGLRKWLRQIAKKSLFDQMVEHSQLQKNNLMPLQKQRMWKIFHILCFCIQFHTRVYSAFPMFIMINDTFDCQFCRAKNRNIVANDDKIDKLYSKMNPDIPQNTSRYA